jgi:enterochelin esterase-like enzyme
MKKQLIFLLNCLIFSISLFSQPDHGSILNLKKNLAYYNQGSTSIYLDLYTPGGEPMAAGVGAAGKDPKQKPDEKVQVTPVPVLIWLPLPGINKFPTPVASFTGNGYAIVSVEHNSESDIIKTISRVISFLKGNSQKYNLDTKNIGIIQQVERGYLAVIWEDGLKRLEILSDAPVRIGISAPADGDFSKFLSSVNSKTIMGFFDRHLRDGVHKESDPLFMISPADSWVDPIINPIPGTTWHLFPTATRGKNAQGSYLILLPEGYSFSDKKYPVIYWLHGGNGNSREGAWMCEKMKEAMQKGDMPQSIVVFVQGLPVGWYNNSKDSTMPVEDVIIKDLVPYIDANYRTINKRESRAIEGMSMGGYGSLHLGFKYPEMFGVVSSIAPSITTFEMERKEIITPVFEDDTAYFNLNSPAVLVARNADLIRGKTIIRLLVGDKDFLLDLIREFDKKLTDLKIDHQYAVVKGADHDYRQVITNLGFNSFTFWRDAFIKPD